MVCLYLKTTTLPTIVGDQLANTKVQAVCYLNVSWWELRWDAASAAEVKELVQKVITHCYGIRVVCATAPMLVGIAGATLLWREPLHSKRVLFQGTSTSHQAHCAAYTHPSAWNFEYATLPTFAKYSSCAGKFWGHQVYLRVDEKSKEPVVRDGNVIGVSGTHYPCTHFDLSSHVEVLREGTVQRPLAVGDWVAYLLPTEPVTHQTPQFAQVTNVVGGITLHNKQCTKGLDVVRVDMATQSIVWPVISCDAIAS